MTQLLKSRNRDIIECARRILRQYQGSKRSLTLYELASLTAMCRPKSYYVEYDNASYHVRRIDKEVVLNLLQQAMWRELAVRVREVMSKRPKLRFNQALNFVLTFQRPSRFFLSTDAIMRIIKPWFRSRLVYVDCDAPAVWMESERSSET